MEQGKLLIKNKIQGCGVCSFLLWVARRSQHGTPSLLESRLLATAGKDEVYYMDINTLVYS